MVEESVVKVFASEEGVAVGRLHLEDTLLDFQDADVEGSAAKIENGDSIIVTTTRIIADKATTSGSSS